MPDDGAVRKNLPLRGRLAPSPTGYLHVGNAFSFVLAGALAIQQGASLVLRMEDIDPDRSKEQFEEGIMIDLDWLGLLPTSPFLLSPSQHANSMVDCDFMPTEAKCKAETRGYGTLQSLLEQHALMGVSRRGTSGKVMEVMHQSARKGLYQAVIDFLLQHGLAYPCFCTRKELRLLASAPHIGDEGAPYSGTCRSLSASQVSQFLAQGKKPAIRLDTVKAVGLLQKGFIKTDAATVHALTQGFFDDGILGRLENSLERSGGDFALQRSDGVFSYQLAASVDDACTGITQVVRGNDLISSTPRQMLLISLLTGCVPCYYHVPLLHTFAGERLAKRHNSLELRVLRQAGVKASALIGYFAYLLGVSEQLECMDMQQFASILKTEKMPERVLELPNSLQEELLAMTK